MDFAQIGLRGLGLNARMNLKRVKHLNIFLCFQFSSLFRTIDLRGRIDGRTSFGRKVVEAEEADHENDVEDDENNVSERKEKLLMREHKIQKLLKKQEMEKLLYKAEKKAKKKEEKRRLKSQVQMSGILF